MLKLQSFWPKAINYSVNLPLRSTEPEAKMRLPISSKPRTSNRAASEIATLWVLFPHWQAHTLNSSQKNFCLILILPNIVAWSYLLMDNGNSWQLMIDLPAITDRFYMPSQTKMKSGWCFSKKPSPKYMVHIQQYSQATCLNLSFCSLVLHNKFLRSRKGRRMQSLSKYFKQQRKVISWVLPAMIISLAWGKQQKDSLD